MKSREVKTGLKCGENSIVSRDSTVVESFQAPGRIIFGSRGGSMLNA